jgi:uroporphyrinogen-III decarboxylase
MTETMSNRERILTLLQGNRPDRVPWFGDLDYWYAGQAAHNRLPAAYAGDGYFQLNRDCGVGFYLQGFYPFSTNYGNITFSTDRQGDRQSRTIHTPHGDLTEIRQYLPLSSSWGIVKHPVNDAADLPAFMDYIRQQTYEPAYDEIQRRQAIIGDNGVVLCYTPRSPFMQLITTDAGVENLVYLLVDAPDEMAELFCLMTERHDQAAELTVASPAECVMIPENLSSEVVGLHYYRQYLQPWESCWVRQMRQAGKYSFIHMDGTLGSLVSEVARTGFDVIEAVTPLPCGDLSMAEVIERVPGPTILWGGLPGVMFTPATTQADFEAHVIAMLDLMRQEPRFVLGVADQVPPDGLLERVRAVAGLCGRWGRY